jgi:hypothetical protein
MSYDVRVIFTSSCLWEGECLMMFGSSLPPVVCGRVNIKRCSGHLYLQLFVGG